MATCGRPTNAGTPCRVPRVGLPFPLGTGAIFGLPVPDLPASCWRHMTPADDVYMEALRAVADAECERLRAEVKPPACWAWPVPADLPAAPDRVTALRLLRAWQAGRCAICPGPAEVLDHDHVTALVRGRLCRDCNTREGFAYDPADPCVQYRARNPASILGLTIRYYSPITGWAEPAPEIDEAERLDRHPAHVLATRYGARKDT